LPEDDVDDVLVPNVRRRRSSATLQESMETAVSKSEETREAPSAKEKGAGKTKQQMQRPQVIWTEEEVRKRPE